MAAQTWKLSLSLDVFLRKYFLFKPACDLLADLKTFCWILFRLHAKISQLHGAALVITVTMTLTSILHWRHKLSALFNGSINTVSSVLWAVGFGLLADAMKETAPAFHDRGMPRTVQLAPSAPSLPLYEAYTSGRKGPSHGA